MTQSAALPDEQNASTATQSRDSGAQELPSRLSEISAKILEQVMDLKRPPMTQPAAPPDKTADREPEAPTPAPTMDFKPINQIPMLTPFIPRPRRILIVTSDQRRPNGLPARDLALLFVSL